jgi:hypothetical protein
MKPSTKCWEMMQKETAVPEAEGTIETFGFWSPAPLSDCQHWSIVPFLLRRPDYGGQAGTDSSLRTLTQPGKTFGAGLLSTCPSGTACLQP